MVSMDLFVAKDVHIDNPKKIEKRKHTKVVIHWTCSIYIYMCVCLDTPFNHIWFIIIPLVKFTVLGVIAHFQTHPNTTSSWLVNHPISRFIYTYILIYIYSGGFLTWGYRISSSILLGFSSINHPFLGPCRLWKPSSHIIPAPAPPAPGCPCTRSSRASLCGRQPCRRRSSSPPWSTAPGRWSVETNHPTPSHGRVVMSIYWRICHLIVNNDG